MGKPFVPKTVLRKKQEIRDWQKPFKENGKTILGELRNQAEKRNDRFKNQEVPELPVPQNQKIQADQLAFPLTSELSLVCYEKMSLFYGRRLGFQENLESHFRGVSLKQTKLFQSLHQ